MLEDETSAPAPQQEAEEYFDEDDEVRFAVLLPHPVLLQTLLKFCGALPQSLLCFQHNGGCRPPAGLASSTHSTS